MGYKARQPLRRRGTNMKKQRMTFTLIGILLFAAAARSAPTHFNVHDHGALGDGKTLDSPAINKAIDACSAAGGGQVFVPAGRYLTGTIHLKSNVTLKLDDGAVIVGTPDLDQYQNFTP